MAKEETVRHIDNSFGTASVVLGIISIVFSSLVGVSLGIVGLAFSMKQKKIMKNKWSKAGIILNAIGIILGLILFIYATVSLLKNPQFLAQFQQLTNAQ